MRDDRLTIELSCMQRVIVDLRTRTARADGDALLEELDAETQLHGLLVPGG